MTYSPISWLTGATGFSGPLASSFFFHWAFFSRFSARALRSGFLM